MSANNWSTCPGCGAEGQLREDYELGIFDKEFYVVYKGECYSCGFKFQFNHEEKV